MANRSLTNGENLEIAETHARLINELELHGYTDHERTPVSDINHFFNHSDLNMLRLFDKLLAASSYTTDSIILTQGFLEKIGMSESSEWLTLEHLNMYVDVYYAILGIESREGRYDTANRNEVCRLLFPDLADAPLIRHLVVDREITDYRQIKRAIREMPKTHSAVQDGSL